MHVRLLSALSRYNIPRGAHAFDYSDSMNLVATGGLDMQVRLWNPYVPFPPVAVFPGHLSTVVQIVFNNSYKQLISLDINETIRIWDLTELVGADLVSILFRCFLLLLLSGLVLCCFVLFWFGKVFFFGCWWCCCWLLLVGVGWC